MKKYFFFVLALLIFSGVANAAGIPTVADPKNSAEVWTQEVFNDSGSTLSSGTVVIWDYTDTDMAALANRRPYVTTTTTADHIAVAGITVTPSCPDQTECAIAIYGPVRAVATGTGVTEATAVGTSATAGKVAGYANTSTDDGIVGWSVEQSTDDEADGGLDISIVFVNPSIAGD